LLGDGIEVSCGIHLLMVEDPPLGLKSQADLELCNAKTFDLIQMVQRCQTSDERKNALKQLIIIDGALDSRMD